MLSHKREKITRHLYHTKTQRTLQKRQKGGRGSVLYFELTVNGSKRKEAQTESSQACEADVRSLGKQCRVATGSTRKQALPGAMSCALCGYTVT